MSVRALVMTTKLVSCGVYRFLHFLEGARPVERFCFVPFTRHEWSQLLNPGRVFMLLFCLVCLGRRGPLRCPSTCTRARCTCGSPCASPSHQAHLQCVR